jgi:hypothetical protein
LTQSDHPVSRLLEWLPDCDFAVLEHGLADHGRDYYLLIEHSGYNHPGRHRIIFTHTVELSLTSQVRDDVWPRSWSDVFIDYAAWEQAGQPDGYVWGVNWSLAYPGIKPVEPSSRAANWSQRIQHAMHEMVLTTNQFQLNLIFHDVRTEKIDDRTDLISQTIIPLK